MVSELANEAGRPGGGRAETYNSVAGERVLRESVFDDDHGGPGGDKLRLQSRRERTPPALVVARDASAEAREFFYPVYDPEPYCDTCPPQPIQLGGPFVGINGDGS